MSNQQSDERLEVYAVRLPKSLIRRLKKEPRLEARRIVKEAVREYYDKHKKV